MKQFYVGDMVAYTKETKEWKVIKAELVDQKHGEVVMYTIEKVAGQGIGNTEEVIGDDLN